MHSKHKTIKSKYLLTTTFTNRQLNEDITTGSWRTLNLQINPFRFPEPKIIINENCSEQDYKYIDKSLALYLIEDIKILSLKERINLRLTPPNEDKYFTTLLNVI